MPRKQFSSKLEENTLKTMEKLRDRRNCVGPDQISELADAVAEGTKQVTARSMWFLEPREAQPLSADKCPHKHPVRRMGFMASHAMILTANASQGQTLRTGVTIDCARKPPVGMQGMDDDGWWLHLYVMFSRATRLLHYKLVVSRAVFVHAV